MTVKASPKPTPPGLVGINKAGGDIVCVPKAVPVGNLISPVEPGADSGDYSHDGNEAGIVISGTLDLVVNNQFFRLEEGDSSTSVHRCGNSGKGPTKVVWVITPPHY